MQLEEILKFSSLEQALLVALKVYYKDFNPWVHSDFEIQLALTFKQLSPGELLQVIFLINQKGIETKCC
jgi:hypothetical protein